MRDHQGSRVPRRVVAVLGSVAAASLALPWLPARADIELSSWAARAEAAPVYTTVDLPGTLPFSPLLNVNLSYALSEMSVSQNHAVAAPLWPGSVVGGLPGALALLGLPVPPEVLQAIAGGVGSLYAESYYPNGGKVEGPVPTLGDPASFGVSAARASAETAEDSASAHTNGASIVAAGMVEVSGVKSTSSTKVEGTVVRSTAATSVARVDIAGVLTLEGISAVAEHASDKPGEPKASFGVARCSITGVPCAVGPDGVTLTGQSVSLPAAAEANAALEALEEQGVVVRLGKVVKRDSGIEVHALDVAVTVPLGAGIPVGVPLPVSPPDSVAVSVKISRAVASAQAGEAEPPTDVAGAAGDAVGGTELGGSNGELDASAIGSPAATAGSLDADGSAFGAASPPRPSGGAAAGPSRAGNAVPTGAVATVARVANLGPGSVLASGLVVLAVALGVGMVAVRRLT